MNSNWKVSSITIKSGTYYLRECKKEADYILIHNKDDSQYSWLVH